MASMRCQVCGRAGRWTAYYNEEAGYRCINHMPDPKGSQPAIRLAPDPTPMVTPFNKIRHAKDPVCSDMPYCRFKPRNEYSQDRSDYGLTP